MKKVERKILLNPGPATTTDTVKDALVVADICPREKDFGALIEGIKSDLVTIAHGGEEYACALFAASGTGGLEAAITSAVPAGKKLLVVENGAYGARMINIAETFGIETVKYGIPYGDYPNVKDIENLLEQHADVSHLAVVHHETTTGMLNPVGEICALARSFGVEVIVDAMSSYAGIPINVREWGVGYLVSSSNKCIQGMPGLAFVLFKTSLLEQELRYSRRSFYFNIYNQHIGFEKTRQMPFTPPVQVCYALRQAIDEYFDEGEQGRWLRYRQNWKILTEGLRALGFSFLLPDSQQSKILLAVEEPATPGYNFEAMHDDLYRRGFTVYPGKGAKRSTFRLSVLGDLHAQDIGAFLRALKDYLSTV